jgi:hypothetical protein
VLSKLDQFSWIIFLYVKEALPPQKADTVVAPHKSLFSGKRTLKYIDDIFHCLWFIVQCQ